MLIWEGIVTRKHTETYVDAKDGGKKKEAIRFAIENTGLLVGDGLTLDDLPDVGTHVRAVVNRVYMNEKKRDIFFYLGLSQSPQVQQAPQYLSSPAQTHYPNGQSAPVPAPA